MAEIIPAILPSSLPDLRDHLGRIRGAARLVQIDFVDGIFAKNRTWPYTEGGRKEFDAIVAEEEGFPYWEDFDFQFDLMVARPADEVRALIAAGASSIIIHALSAGALEGLRELQMLRDGDYPVSAGIALSATAVPADLTPFVGLYDFVQVMGIDREGFQGEPFDEKALALVAALCATYPEVPIQVDGAVTPENAGALMRAGAAALVVGHAIFRADDPKKEYRALYTSINAERR